MSRSTPDPRQSLYENRDTVKSASKQKEKTLLHQSAGTYLEHLPPGIANVLCDISTDTYGDNVNLTYD